METENVECFDCIWGKRRKSAGWGEQEQLAGYQNFKGLYRRQPCPIRVKLHIQIKTFEGFGNPRVAAKDKAEALEYFYMKCTDDAATKCKMIIDVVGELLKKPTAYFQEQR